MKICCRSSKLPVRPPIMMLKGGHLKDGDAAGAAASPEEDLGEVVAEPEVKAKVAKGLPDVYEPTPAEVARHCLTHLPYKRWCKWCVAARMRNYPHWTLPPFSRSSPLLVLDYCFVKHSGDEQFLTVLVGCSNPS